MVRWNNEVAENDYLLTDNLRILVIIQKVLIPNFQFFYLLETTGKLFLFSLGIIFA